MIGLKVVVDVATMWTSPDAPREVDRSAVAPAPDVAAWTAAMDREARLGLHGRTLTQLLREEPVEPLEHSGGWLRVAAPWQPSPTEPRGYPGWVRHEHVAPATGDEPRRPVPHINAERVAILEYARRFVGLRYLWGGTSEWGLDCSGLVHYAYRQAGIVVPRDACAQHAAAAPVELGDEEPGDLYFFARANGRVFHVGFVTGRLRMLHAPEGGGLIEDAELADDRLDTLVAAGRLPTS